MTLEEFTSSLSQQAPPPGKNVYLQALWYDGKGNWRKAHEIVQDLHTPRASRIHAYLHRKEGDQGNASYWYSRVGSNMPSVSLEEEWEEMVVGELKNDE